MSTSRDTPSTSPERRDDSHSGFSGRESGAGGGDSGGGAYPNPHTGKKPENDGFMGHGGQTDMPYHGGGQLGAEAVEGNENAPAAKTKPGKSGEREG